MGKVARLPDDLINQIAAGEVVERPASVVKELVENALDAGATSIRIELSEGGLSRISVTDDGSGMAPDDARLCLERHATSKLRDAEGLARIATLGFRGEALPSIASVAKLTLTTREQDALAATRIRIEGGAIVEEGEAGAPAGTQVVVEDLFFNTPARRKFAKRPETEAGHCVEAVIRVALARPDVAFQLSSNGRTSFSSPANADATERIAAAISPELHKLLIPVELRRGGFAVTGWVASPDYSLSTNRGIYTFINQRFVRDRGLLHAVGRAYANVLAPGRQPAAVLHLDVPLDQVDVNVHPQKLEVRFVDARNVYDLVVEAIRTALRDSPWLAHRPESGSRSVQSPRYEPARFDFRPAPQPTPMQVAEAVDLYRTGPAPSWDASRELDAPVDDRGDGMPGGYFGSLRYIGQLAATYLVCEAPGGTLVLVDQHASHERVRFDALRKQFAAGTLQGQGFLFPVQVQLPVPDARALLDHQSEVAKLGFELEPFGGDVLALKSVPALLAGADYKQLLTDIAQELAHLGQQHAADDALSHVLATMACHSAVRAHQALSEQEARALLDELDRIDFKARCPHGRPVAAELTLGELERRVHRR
ncbi:MAG: DNA mismatch repair endonuclease MutL [Deltaproteobacteria bacterium]|nr:DNA mismatch repair endonuclease MutL [Deltaproteobacteria bacterium]